MEPESFIKLNLHHKSIDIRIELKIVYHLFFLLQCASAPTDACLYLPTANTTTET